ncbi:hypothetical protein [Vibrio mediterranei]|uniref:hypothetical protein n=1 Tax=Vibrio mediterranei TaxID=689 RepID=UPI0040678B47
MLDFLHIFYLVIYRAVVELGVYVHGEHTREWGSWADYAAMLTVLLSCIGILLIGGLIVKLLKMLRFIEESK